MTAAINDNALLATHGWIDGRDVTADNRFAVHNPATEQVLAEVDDLGATHAQAAIAAAQRAFLSWRETDTDTRVRAIEHWATLIDAHADELGQIVCLESGKPMREALGEAGQCAALLRWFAERAQQLEGQVLPPIDGQKNRTIKQPVGVVACITPWNFPAAAVVVKAGAAIATGCSAIVKPSEETPLIALALARLAHLAGIPHGVLNVLPCKDAAAIGTVLCQSDTVRMLSFTGSTRVGQYLYSACGPTVKRLALELGGNAPLIVFDDADIDRALDGAMGARFYNSGQICVGANRMLVQSGIYDRFAERLASRVGKLRVGDGSDASSDIGPMINRAAVERLTGLVDNAVAAGAAVLAGGKQAETGSLFFEPTVLAGMTPDMLAWQTEVFGPVACLYRFDTDEDALRLGNDTEAGLAAYVYSGDAARLERFERELEAGVVGANTTAIFAIDLPFGGIKQSGIGREHGLDCLDEFIEVKSICKVV